MALPHYGGDRITTEVFLYYTDQTPSGDYCSSKIRIHKWCNIEQTIYLDTKYLSLSLVLSDFQIIKNRFQGDKQFIKKIYKNCNIKNTSILDNEIILRFDHDDLEVIENPKEIKKYIRNQKFKKILE